VYPRLEGNSKIAQGKRIAYDYKKSRKPEHVGHIMRNNQRYGLLQLQLQGKLEGKLSVGRRRISWSKNLRDRFGVTSSELFRTSLERERIFFMISYVRNGSEPQEEEEPVKYYGKCMRYYKYHPYFQIDRGGFKKKKK